MPPNFLFSISVQSIIGPSVPALTSNQEPIVDQLAQSGLDVRNRMVNVLFQQPPFRDAFDGILSLRVPRHVGENFIGQRAARIIHAV